MCSKQTRKFLQSPVVAVAFKLKVDIFVEHWVANLEAVANATVLETRLQSQFARTT